jgi:hypothetical protein
MKRLLLLGFLAFSVALRADEGAVDVAVADDGGVSDAGELLKPIDDAVELPAVELVEAVVEPVEVVVASAEKENHDDEVVMQGSADAIESEASVDDNNDLIAVMEAFADAYQDKEDDVTSFYAQPGVVLDEEHDLEVQHVIEGMVAQEEAALQAEDAITTLIEYQALEDLLKTEPHKNGKLFVIVKKLLRAGFGVATSTGLGHLIKTKASTWADKHSLPLHAGLGILACGLYEVLLYTWQDNQAVYRSILGHIVQNWNIYTMLIPEEYVDTFNQLHGAYVQNGNQLTLTEKEAKNIVKTMKYSVRSEIKKRKPQSHMHDKKR